MAVLAVLCPSPAWSHRNRAGQAFDSQIRQVPHIVSYICSWMLLLWWHRPETTVWSSLTHSWSSMPSHRLVLHTKHLITQIPHQLANDTVYHLKRTAGATTASILCYKVLCQAADSPTCHRRNAERDTSASIHHYEHFLPRPHKYQCSRSMVHWHNMVCAHLRLGY